MRSVTWNVRGAGTSEKRLKIFNRLQDLQADIVLLQETHLPNSSIDLLTAQFPHAYSAGYNSRQRGVAILINRRLNFTVENTITDPEGRFVVVTLTTQNTNLTKCR